MRFNEHELYRMACSAATQSTMQGKLFYKGIQQGKLRPVRDLQGQAFRERDFRLLGNFLFYYKPNEDRRAPEPLGALLLERCTVQREMNAEKGFVFSIAFQDDREKKHFFLASTAQLCDQWVLAIRNASYEQLKATWIMLHNKIRRLTDMQQAANNQQQQQQQPAGTVSERPTPARTPPLRPPPPLAQQQPTQMPPARPPPPAAKQQPTPAQIPPARPPPPPQPPTAALSAMPAQARTPPERPPPPPPQQQLLQPRRNAPLPPAKAAGSTSTPQEPAEGLLIDFS